MIRCYDWPHGMEDIDAVDGIERELAYFRYSEIRDSAGFVGADKYPRKFGFFMLLMCTSGRMKLRINLDEYDVAAPCMIRMMPGQIVSVEEMSGDFDAMVSVMSRNFIENLLIYVSGNVSVGMRWRDDMVVGLGENDIRMYENFFDIMRHIVRVRENPYRLKVVEHVMMAFFYNSPDMVSKVTDSSQPRSSADVLSKDFMALARDNFRTERQLKFYADRLCITPRYLSRVVKECSGYSAAEWIERYVILEARALLKSTDMTVQQISDSLNFPTQTFFGKYFKRRVGMSPKKYRRMG